MLRYTRRLNLTDQPVLPIAPEFKSTSHVPDSRFINKPDGIDVDQLRK